MGLLDYLTNSGNGDPGGGLLSFLNSLQQGQSPPQMGLPSDQAQYGTPAAQAPVFAPQPAVTPQTNPQPSPMDNAQWPLGPIGAPSQANAQMPLNPQGSPLPSAPPAAPMALPPQNSAPAPADPQQPGFLDRLNGGLQSLGHGGSIIGALTGNLTDPTSIAKAQQAQVANVTAKALIAKGVDPQIAIAAVQPGNAEFLKTLVTQNFGPQPVTSLGEGYVTDKNGKVTRAYTPEQKDNFAMVQTGEDGQGNKIFQKMNKATGDMTPIAGAAPAGAGIGDMSKTGADFLATVPKEKQGILQGMVDGTIQPPSSFAASKPYWQNLLAGAKQLDPKFDENQWSARHKMSVDMAASGNSSMGGILSNGKSSFSHLADLSESMADLGNTSHDYPLGGYAAAAQNYMGNSILAGSDTKAKIKAINDNLGHYGQESTKFYSGTGGGAEERMNALKEVNPVSSSGEEMAAYVNKEKGLMLERLRQKEDQIRDTMGDAYLARHPVMTPQLQATIDKIDTNTAKMRGQSAAASAPAGAPKPGAYVWSPSGGVQPK